MSDNNCPPAYDNVINDQKPNYPNQQQAYPTHSYPVQSYPPQGYPPQVYQQTTTSVVVRAGTTGNPAIVYNNLGHVNRRYRTTGLIVGFILFVIIINIIAWANGMYDNAL